MSPTILISAWMMGTVLVVSCQAPSEPAAIKSADSGSVKTSPSASPSPYGNNNTVGASVPSAAALTSCGLQVGNPAMDNPLIKCRDAGMFYDRQSSNPDPNQRCTTVPIAKIPCSIDGVKSVMTPSDAGRFGKFMTQGGPLDGFVIDQILDCSSPAAASVSDCKMDNLPAGAKVIKIYFAKQVSNLINIKFLPVAVPATK